MPLLVPTQLVLDCCLTNTSVMAHYNGDTLIKDTYLLTSNRLKISETTIVSYAHQILLKSYYLG